eukprot:ANDGO_02353.mRNA.1 Hermansky-Pudlak syndrome 5 protein homolog
MAITISERPFRDVSSLLPTSRVKFTCISVGAKLLSLGTTSGTVFVLQRLTGQMVMVAQPEGFAGVEISSVLLSPNEMRLAVCFADPAQPVVVLDLESIAARETPKVISKVSEHKGSIVTELSWDSESRTLFTGDIQGNVFSSIVGGSKLTMRKSERVFFEPGSPIVQLQFSPQTDTLPVLLIVSTIKRVVVCDLSRKEMHVIGTKVRDGMYGAFFDATSVSLYATRPGFRMWVADWQSGQVLNTWKFAIAADSTQQVPDKGAQLGRLLPFSPQTPNAYLCWDGGNIYLLDMSNITIPVWNSQQALGKMIGVCCFDGETYILHETDSVRITVWKLVEEQPSVQHVEDADAGIVAGAPAAAAAPPEAVPDVALSESQSASALELPIMQVSEDLASGRESPTGSSLAPVHSEADIGRSTEDLMSVHDPDSAIPLVPDATVDLHSAPSEAVDDFLSKPDAPIASSRGRTKSRTARTVDLNAAPVMQPSAHFVPMTLQDLRTSPPPDVSEEFMSPKTKKSTIAGQIKQRMRKKKPTSPVASDESKRGSIPDVEERNVGHTEAHHDVSGNSLNAVDASLKSTSPISPPSHSVDDIDADATHTVCEPVEQTVIWPEENAVDESVESLVTLLNSLDVSAEKLTLSRDRSRTSPALATAVFAYYINSQAFADAFEFLSSHLEYVDQWKSIQLFDISRHPEFLQVFLEQKHGILSFVATEVEKTKNKSSYLCSLYPALSPFLVKAVLKLPSSVSDVQDTGAFASSARVLADYSLTLLQRFPDFEGCSDLLTYATLLALKCGISCPLISQMISQPFKFPVDLHSVLDSLFRVKRFEDCLRLFGCVFMNQSQRVEFFCTTVGSWIAQSSKEQGFAFSKDKISVALDDFFCLPDYCGDLSQDLISFFRVVGSTCSSYGAAVGDAEGALLSTLLSRVASVAGFGVVSSVCRHLRTDACFDWKNVISQEFLADILGLLNVQFAHREPSVKILESLDGYLWSSADPSLPPQLRMLSEFELGVRSLPSGHLFDPNDVVASQIRDQVSFWSLEDGDVHWGCSLSCDHLRTISDIGTVFVSKDGKILSDR